MLDDQGRLRPDFEADRRTARDEILHRERDLSELVDQRLTVVRHPHRE